MLGAALALIFIGLAVVLWALWKCAEAQEEGLADKAGAYVVAFAAGMGLTILGALALAGQLFWRVIA